MTLSNITISLDLEDMEEVKKITDNISLFVRNAIKDKLGKQDKSLQEIMVEIEQKALELTILEDNYTNKINALLEHKEQLRLSEIEELEQKVKDKAQKALEFFNKWKPILEPLEEIHTFDPTEENLELPNLMPLVDKLLEKNIRIGVMGLRSYFILRDKFKET